MLALQSSSSGSRKTQLNILPCRIQHNGSAKVTKRLWAPVAEQDGTRTAYFRGRKLRGRRIKLAKNYHGVTVSKSEQILPLDTKEPRATRSPRLEDGEDILDDEEPPEAVKILKEEAKFDEMTVWGHDRLPATDDNFVKGIEEWIAFAEAIHATPIDDSKTSNDASS